MQIISRLSRPEDTPYPTSFFAAVLVFLISAIVFGQSGFEGTLLRDSANALYSGQQMARGIPHYVSIFDHSGVLAPLISGVGVSIATLFNFDDILTVRIMFFALGSLAVVGLYLLGSTLFESQQIGLLAAFVFMGFWCFGKLAASGPRNKTPMVLFATLSLLLTARKKWFWAGICGSSALLAWQPAAIYPLVTIFLAITQSERGRERARNVLSAISGMLIPIAIVSAYFLYKDAFYQFIDGTILFHIKHFERPPSPLSYHIVAPLIAIQRGYTVMAIPIFLGFLVICAIYIWRMKLHRGSIPHLLSKDRFAAFLLSFPILVVWSVLDFQGCPDLYVFLPYAAIGFSWLLYCAFHSLMAIGEIGPAVQKVCFLVLCGTLVGSAAMDYRITAENGLQEQRQWAQQVESQFGRDAKLVSIGVPEILVLLHRTNPNPYVFIISGIDNRIDANTPGGFDGWLEELERYDPSVIAFGPTEGRFKAKLMSWLHTHYQETTVGHWRLFVKNRSKE